METNDRRATSAIILAGGLSRRMGADKRRLQLWGTSGPTLLAHSVGVVARLCRDVVVVLNDPESWRALPARLVHDSYPNCGALGGIYSGLVAATNAYALVVACDMPLLNPDLLGAMLARPRDYDLLVPRALEPGTARNALAVEPLHAIYSKACLEPIRTTLESGQRQITAFFAQMRVAYVEPDEIRRYDPTGHSFANVNTPEQLAAVERWLAHH